jgi:ribosomal protein S25
MPAQKSKPIKQVDPWAALDAINKDIPEPHGLEWFSVQDFSKRYGKHIETARRRLRELEEKGIVVSWRGIGSSRRLETKFRAL